MTFDGNDNTRREAAALRRQGALSRATFGKPRGTRTEAAAARTPVPGRYYPNTAAEFVVPAKDFRLDTYLHILWLDIDEETRVLATYVIAEFGDASCVHDLAALLHADRLADGRTFGEEARRGAAFALASIGGPDAEDSLWSALERKACPVHVREAALDGLLDLMTPDGWENYNFQSTTKISLPTNVRERLLRVQDDLPFLGRLLETFFDRDAAVQSSDASQGSM